VPQRRLLAYLCFLTIFCAAFFPVYALGAIYGIRSDSHWRLFMGWETAIPLVEWMVIPYLSLFAAYLVPLFTMTPRELQRLTWQSLVVIGASGACFILLPTTIGFEPVEPEGPVAPLLQLIRLVDGPHNLVPSLHVAGGGLVLLGSAQFASPPLAFLLRLWLAVMIVSTILVHQHHLLDAATGLLLALVVRRLIPLRPAASPASRAGARAGTR
jgi:membrane-associated phospholipid phosphatase